MELKIKILYVPQFFSVCTTKAFSLDTPCVVSNKKNNIQGTTLDFLNIRKRGIKQIELKVIPRNYFRFSEYA